MHGLQTPDVVLDIFADLHFEEAKPLRVPSACQGDGFVEVGDGNGDVGFTRTDVSSAPQSPHRHLGDSAVGIEQRGLKATPCCRLRGGQFSHTVCERTIVLNGFADE